LLPITINIHITQLQEKEKANLYAQKDTQPNVGIAVPGILAPGMVDGEEVNLLPYFNGELASTNTGGMVGRSVNFLDGGGAAPLMENMASNNPESRQE